MKIVKPAYFDSFRCLAAQCPDSCCKEWEVEIDEHSAAFYRSLDGPLGERLRAVLTDDPEWGTVMTIENGRCPMWREDGLCRIHAELGHEALCKTCRDFPRLCHDYGTFQEWGLELSCPEAARLILSAQEMPPCTQNVPGGDTPDYDEAAMAILLQTRDAALQLIRMPQYTCNQVLALLLCYGYHAQALLDGDDSAPFSPEAVLLEAQQLAHAGGEQLFVDFFLQLEILTPDWKSRLLQSLSPTPWTDGFRNLARYFIERYWLQAVSDYDLVSRVKLGVSACILIHLLGGDFLQTCQSFSKEIENSANNVDAILDGAYCAPALTDDKLLGLLLL